MTETRRRTKIVVTLGPATDDPEVLGAMVDAGIDVARLNFSHGDHDDFRRRFHAAREVAAGRGRELAILADLAGPKIRVGKFDGGSVVLENGAEFSLYCRADAPVGDRDGVGVSYPGLGDDVDPGDTLLLDDGMVALEVVEKSGGDIRTRVISGGRVSDHKGVNVKGGGLSIPGLAEHDSDDLRVAAEAGADYVAVSFPRDAADIQRARRLLREHGSDAAVAAKIERSEAIRNLDAIVDASDAVLVARGDLGVEIGDAALPGVQKRIIKTALAHNRVVITATQMMQSMVDNPVPTRAEVLDVANAVIDGTDAVMLSAETAVGHYPVKVVEAMHRICVGAEAHVADTAPAESMQVRFERIDQTIAMAAMFTAGHVAVHAIVALTESGSTVQWLSRVRSAVPIFGLSPNVESRRRMALFRDVYPVAFEPSGCEIHEVAQQALAALFEQGLVETGGRVILTMGDSPGLQGGTNTMKLVQVGPNGQPDPQTELSYR